MPAGSFVFAAFVLPSLSKISRQMTDSLKHRATVRAYSDRPVEDALLDDLFQAAFQASNTGNMQLYSVVVTRSPEGRKALAPAHFNQPQVMSAPVVLTFCADLNRYTQWCRQRQANPGFDNVQSLVYAGIDTIIAAQTFCVAAESKGLGICYLGTTTYNVDRIIDCLGLPPLVVPLTTVTLGWPLNPPVESERLPLEAIVHEERYRPYSEADIDRLHEAKENLPANRRYVEINHKDNLAQVFTDLRYTKKDNEHFSKVFIDTLRRQGFLK